MNCREITEFLDRYLEGDLPMAQTLLFNVHLAFCRNCRRYIATYRSTIRLSKRAVKTDEHALVASIPEDLVKAIVDANASRK